MGVKWVEVESDVERVEVEWVEVERVEVGRVEVEWVEAESDIERVEVEWVEVELVEVERVEVEWVEAERVTLRGWKLRMEGERVEFFSDCYPHPPMQITGRICHFCDLKRDTCCITDGSFERKAQIMSDFT